MPATQVVFFADDDQSCPVLEWLTELRPRKAQDKCIAKVERLRDEGHDLRRPEADFLRDKIYELRPKLSGVHYRILYGFHQQIAVLLHAFIKTGSRVPDKHIDLAVDRLNRFKKAPAKHTYTAGEEE